MRRSAFTLLEMLAVLPLLGAMALVFSMIFPEMIRDVPRMGRAVQTHGALQGMLARMQQDVDASTSLPDSFGQDVSGSTAPRSEASGSKTSSPPSGEHVVLLAGPERVVRYQVVGDDIRRDEFAGAATSQPALRRTQGGLSVSKPAASTTWTLPGAKMSFHRLGDQPGALAVSTAMEIHTRGPSHDRLANTHVFFASGLGGWRASTRSARPEFVEGREKP